MTRQVEPLFKSPPRPKAPRRRLRSISARRLASRPERRAAILAAHHRDGGRCRAQEVWPHVCWGGMTPHEPHKRSQGGDELDPDCVLTVCWFVNGWVEDHPDEACELGLSVRSWETWSFERDWGRS